VIGIISLEVAAPPRALKVMKNSWQRRLAISAILAGTICLAGCSSLPTTSANRAPGSVAYLIGSPSYEIVGYSTVPGDNGSSVGTLTLPPSYWAGPVATDSTGQIYVAAAADPVDPLNLGDIFIYPPNSTGAATPSRTVKLNSGGIAGLALDRAGLLYVAFAGEPNPIVSVYSATASGTATPLRTLQLTNVLQVNDIAADATGNIYVAGYMSPENAIAVYPPSATGPATPARTITLGTSNVYGVAVAATGEIFANICLGCYNTNFGIEEFAPGAYGAATPINIINLNVASSWRIVNGGPVRLDSAGNIFTSLELNSVAPESSSIVVYRFEPTATGNAAPTAQITGKYNTVFALN
jgi:hypothetical protein